MLISSNFESLQTAVTDGADKAIPMAAAHRCFRVWVLSGGPTLYINWGAAAAVTMAAIDGTFGALEYTFPAPRNDLHVWATGAGAVHVEAWD